jgi:hypothetical protein
MPLSLGEEATMFRIVGYSPRPPPEWFKVNIFARRRPPCLSEIEQEEDSMGARRSSVMIRDGMTEEQGAPT